MTEEQSTSPMPGQADAPPKSASAPAIEAKSR
jgi:hypothetical protein